MIKSDLDIALEEFNKNLRLAIIKIMRQKKVPDNSDLIKSVEVKYNTQKDMYEIIANNYMGYVSEGRKRNVKKVPITDLIKWIKKYNINTRGRSANSTAFAIQNAIYKNGIKGKKFIDPIIDVTTDMINEKTIDEIVTMTVDEIVDGLNNS